MSPARASRSIPELMTVIEARRRTARTARDRGQRAEAWLYLEGPRDPLRGSSSGAGGLESRPTGDEAEVDETEPEQADFDPGPQRIGSLWKIQ